MKSEIKEKHPVAPVIVADILNMDVSEMFIIQNLMRYPNASLVAIDLRNQLNATLSGGRSISSSSFYNKLRKLKTNGFVTFLQDESTGKIQSIAVTEKAFMAMSEIKMISIFATSGIAEFIEEMLPSYLEKVGVPFTGKPIYDNVLLINLESGKDLRVFERLCQFGNKTFLVDSENNAEFFLSEEMVKTVEHTDGTIFMPDNYFDACIVVGYACNTAIGLVDGKLWLKEAVRLLKEEGIVHVSAMDDLPETGHFLIDSMIDELHKSPMFKYINADELVEEMELAGLKNIEKYPYKGMILAYGYK